MKSIQEENYEFEKFMIESTHKAKEIQRDFNRLSDYNKNRVIGEVDKIFAAKGLVGVWKYLIRQQ